MTEIEIKVVKYLREIGRKGGQSKSAKKTKAARASLAKVRARRWPKRRAK